MQTTSVTNWPMPKWSAAKMEESRQAAAEASGSLAGALAWVRILAATTGDLEGARQRLAAFRAALDGRRPGSGELRQIIPVALLVHDQRAATECLTAVFATTAAIGFAISSGGDHSVVSMRVAHRSVTFTISDQLFSHEHGEVLLQRLVDVFPILGYYIESALCSDGNVAINLGDAGHTPGLAFCDNRPGYFLIPDSIFMDSRGYSTMRERFSKDMIPWEKRAPTAFWRGSTTGQPLDPRQGWRSLPRLRLCEIGARHLDLIDAGITKVAQIDDPAADHLIAEAGLLRPYVPPESFQQYKYQIDIDGNSTSWPGLFTKLLTGSVVLKVPPRAGFEQWYYDRLQPWRNFIPLAADMSDLAEKVRWLRANDRVAQTIGEAGYRLAEELTYEREIGRAAPTVAAAMQAASGMPVLDLDFAVGGAGVAQLREGWAPVERDGVDAAGFQSRIDLPRPCGIGGFVLGLDVASVTGERQRLSIVLDGELVAQRDIAGRTTLYVPLGRRMLADKAVIAVTLLHPDAGAAASALLPADPRMLSIRLYRMSVLGHGRIDPAVSPELAEALGELRAVDGGERAHDLNGPVPLLPPNVALSALHTHHGTLAYADIAAGRLRHGPADSVPPNLFMAVVDGHAVLVRMTGTGQQRTVRLRPEGRFAGEANGIAPDARVLADRFDIGKVQGGSGAVIALRAAGMFLCAEDSGNVAFGRAAVGPWELFRLVPAA